jgi:hypothetical protein
MTQDNIPISPEESARKHMPWGIISLAISILFIMGELPSATGFVSPFWIFFPYYVSITNWLWWGFPVSLILALIGLSEDRKKIYSIWSLSILGIWLVIFVGAILYGISHGIGGY